MACGVLVEFVVYHFICGFTSSLHGPIYSTDYDKIKVFSMTKEVIDMQQ